MKKRIYLYGIITISLLFLARCSTGLSFVIKGNQNVIIKEIKIEDYERLNINAPIDFEYAVSEGDPFLYMETDENIFDYFKIENVEGTLHISLKNPETGNELRNYSLNATKLVIRSGSSNMKSISKSGSSQVTIMNEVIGGELEVNQSGSGRIVFNHSLTLRSFKANLSGSGNMVFQRNLSAGNIDIERSGSGNLLCHGDVQTKNILLNSSGSGGVEINGTVNADLFELDQNGSGISIFNNSMDFHTIKLSLSGSGKLICKKPVQAESLNISREGSGNLTIGGNFTQGKIYSSGSGSINAVNAIFSQLDCNIAGSSMVSTQVQHSLSCNISGSGQFSYRGNPEIISQSISGSGNIKKIND